jgi:hypothetical protein
MKSIGPFSGALRSLLAAVPLRILLGLLAPGSVSAADRPNVLGGFLKETGAVIPRINPDFGKSARVTEGAPRKKSPDDLPGGWKNRAGPAAVREGVLNVRTKGDGSFLGVGVALPAGTGRLTLRVRAPRAGEGKITLLGQAGGPEALSVPYRVTGGSIWETVTVELPAKEKTGILRLYLPSGSEAVDFDDILLTSPRVEARRWTFGS